MTTAFSPGRLTLARRRRGLTKVALGDRTGLTARRIAALENEGEQPTDQTIARLAEATGFPVEFFSKTDPPDLEPAAVSFRSFTRMSARQRDAAIAAGAIAVELSRWIAERFDLPVADVPDLREVDPRTAANATRQHWGLGSGPAPNMIHLLESHGVRVFSLMDDCAEVDAFSTWEEGVPHILLSLKKSAERGRWDAAHELGHLTLHLGYPPNGRVQEHDADDFASEFLMPTAGVLATAPRRVTLASVRSEKLRWRVSALAYIRRLYQLNVLSEWQYRQLVIEASSAGYRRVEDDIDRERSQVASKVVGLLGDDNQSVATIAADLGVPADDLCDLMFGLPLRPVRSTGSATTTAPRRNHLTLAPNSNA